MKRRERKQGEKEKERRKNSCKYPPPGTKIPYWLSHSSHLTNNQLHLFFNFRVMQSAFFSRRRVENSSAKLCFERRMINADPLGYLSSFESTAADVARNSSCCTQTNQNPAERPRPITVLQRFVHLHQATRGPWTSLKIPGIWFVGLGKFWLDNGRPLNSYSVC